MAQLGCAACKSFGQRLIDNHLWSPNTHKTASRYAKWKKGKGSWFRCDILATLAHLLFKNFQGLGQCLSGHYHHKLVKIVFSWRIGLLCSLQKKVTCFRTFHSLQFCLVVLLSQKNSRATWLFYCYFILLGPQGVSKPPKRILSFMAFFLYTKLDYWWTIGGTFFMTTFIQILASFGKKMKMFYRQRFWMEIRVHLFYNKF